MTASLTDIGLIFMVNILLISNYYFVRALRKTVDYTPPRSENDDRRSNLLIAFRERFTSSRFLGGWNQSYNTMSTSTSRDEPDRKCTLHCFQNTAFACVFGRHVLTPSIEKRFPGWRPIPYKLGIISTCFALLITIVLLSTEIVEDRISVNPIRSGNDSAGLCSSNEFDQKIEDFREKMLDLTNYKKGERQKNAIVSFTNSLLDATTDYGTESDNGCQGEKMQYEQQNKHILQGPFFPSYCPEARNLSLIAAEQTCAWRERICGGALSCNVTQEVPIICPPHSNDADTIDTQNYRLKQFESLAQQNPLRDSLDELNKEDFTRKSAEFVADLLKQINTAGTLYSIYVCVGLFFPSPLRLYRPSMFVRAKQILFGVDKKSFIVIVLLVWWLVKYIEIITTSFEDHKSEVELYIQNFINDPCFLNLSFLTERFKVWKNVCEDLSNYENEWNVSKVQIDQIKQEVEAFDNSCSCQFSGNKLRQFSSNVNAPLYDEIEFYNMTWNVTGGEAFWTPNLNSTFLGKTSICGDSQQAKDNIFASGDMELNFWGSWVETGLLANLLVKIAITNFCVALLNLADPFVACGGTYECPPAMSDHDDDDTTAAESSFTVSEKVKNDKAAALKAIAIRQSLFWGVITNACLFCLLIVAVTNVNSFNVLDFIVFGSLIVISFSVPCCCFFLTYYMSANIPSDSSSWEIRC